MWFLFYFSSSNDERIADELKLEPDSLNSLRFTALFELQKTDESSSSVVCLLLICAWHMHTLLAAEMQHVHSQKWSILLEHVQKQWEQQLTPIVRHPSAQNTRAHMLNSGKYVHGQLTYVTRGHAAKKIHFTSYSYFSFLTKSHMIMAHSLKSYTFFHPWSVSCLEQESFMGKMICRVI